MNPTIIGILGLQISVIGEFMQLDPTTHATLAAPLIILTGLLITIGAVVLTKSDDQSSGKENR